MGRTGSKVPTTPTKSGLHRVQFDFPANTVEGIQSIKKMSGTRTNSQAMQNAIRLYEWYLQKRAEGKTLQLTKDGVITEVEILF